MTARRSLSLLLATAALLAVPSGSTALDLTAPLAPLASSASCVRDVSAAGGACAAQSPGLLGASALAVLDPSGAGGTRRLAVAAPDDDAVALLRRFSPSGSILPGTCIQPPGETTCPLHAAGLQGADALLATPDGSLDVGARDAHAVVELRGTSETACVSAGAVPGCAGRDHALGEVAALATDPVGADLYAVSFGPRPGTDTVAGLSRSPTGTLTPLAGAGACAQSLGDADSRCSVRTAGLEGAAAAALSPDGRSLYVAARTSSAVAAFRRDPHSGALAALGCVGSPGHVAADDRRCPRLVPALRGADAVAVAPDGRTVYVAAADPGSLIALRRNRTTGALIGMIGCLSVVAQPSCATAPTLRGARAILLAPSGFELDVAADGADAVSAVGLAPDGGFDGPPAATSSAGHAVNAPAALAQSCDRVYAASPYDDGVVALQRDEPPPACARSRADRW